MENLHNLSKEELIAKHEELRKVNIELVMENVNLTSFLVGVITDASNTIKRRPKTAPAFIFRIIRNKAFKSHLDQKIYK